jgi:hypothetical protein
MDRNAFSLALGILAFVLSYSSLGISWLVSLPVAVGTMIAMQIAHHVHNTENTQRSTTSGATRLKQCGRKGHLRAQSLNAIRG